MTSRIRVPIWGLNKSVMISGDATKGAQIGTNLLLPDGSLATLATLAKALGVTAAVPNASPNISVTPVLWSRILGIPNRVLQPPFCDDTAAPGADGDAIPGPRGLQGVPGIGIPGDDGYMGSDGDQGAPGAAGAASTVPGPQGPPGAPIPADDGRDGYDGDPVPGPQGPQGAASTVPGPAGVAGPPGDDGFVGSDGDVAIFPSAPPSTLIGLTAITGTATTTMRSDAAPALDVTISPTWTGNHTFTPVAGGTVFSPTASGITVKIGAPGSGSIGLSVGVTPASGSVPLAYISSASSPFYSAHDQTNAIEFLAGVNGITGVFLGSFTNHPMQLRTNNVLRINIAAAGNVTINAPVSGTAFSATGFAGSPAALFVTGAVADHAVRINSIASGRVTMQLDVAGVNKGFFGINNAAGDLLGGSGLNDLIFRVGAQNIGFTTNAGTNAALTLMASNAGAVFGAPAAGNVTVTVNAIAGSLGIDAQNGVRAPAIVVDRQFASEGDISANGSCVVDDYMQLGAGKVMNIGAGGTLSIGLNPVLYLPTNGIFSSSGRLAN